MRKLAFAFLLLLCCSQAALAHEVRPAYLELTEIQPGRYAVLWKVPRRGELALGLHVQWPATSKDAIPPAREAVGDALVERRILETGPEGLAGQQITIDGLERTMTDVLVRIDLLDGGVQTSIVKPGTPYFVVEGRRPMLDVAWDYLALGVEHILGGIDHLLFVTGLLLIVRGKRLLVKTVTAFTLAHSVTLGMAALGFVHVPQAPVEAVIALSILFLARELIRQQRGETGLTARYPWLVAMTFGLLHGFGFAGALSEVGLPESDVPLALLAFNAGVEVGQLLFVGAALALGRASRKFAGEPGPLWPRAAAYGLGGTSAFWLVSRVAAFW